MDTAVDNMTDIATEIWAAAQCTPHEGVENAVARIEAILLENFGHNQLHNGACLFCGGVGCVRCRTFVPTQEGQLK